MSQLITKISPSSVPRPSYLSTPTRDEVGDHERHPQGLHFAIEGSRDSGSKSEKTQHIFVLLFGLGFCYFHNDPTPRQTDPRLLPFCMLAKTASSICFGGFQAL